MRRIFLYSLFFVLAAGMSWAQSAKQLNAQAEAIINDDPDQSLAIAKKALKKAQAEKNKEQEAEAYLNVGVGMYYLDDYDGGIAVIEKGLNIAKKIGNKNLEGKCEGIIGEIYVYEAKYSQSLKHLSRARSIFESNGNKKDLARCNNSMGIIHKNQYNLNEALMYFKKGFELGDDIRKGDASLSMGEVYIQQKKFTDADKILQTAVDFARKNNDKYVLADAYMALGEVNIAFGKKAQALKYLNDALSIKENVDDQQGISKVCVIMGNLFMSTEEPDKAHDLFLRAVTIAREINTREELKDAYLGLSNTYHLKNNDDSAYAYLDKYNKLNEEILSEEASKKLSQIEESLVAEKRKQEEKQRKQREAYDKFINLVFTWVFIGIILIIGVFGFIMFKRYKEKQKANVEIMKQKDEVEKQRTLVEEQMKIVAEKNHEITDSINYAKRIQQAVLPGDTEFHHSFKDAFVLFKPKDIVSGDFYWFTKLRPALTGRRADSSRTVEEGDKEYIIYATADCTGHGVPGGFMSMLGTSFLNEIINEGKVFDPSKALNQLREKIIAGLKQTGA
ncbi:MAG TPA: tetratricopeptide repeat protein, partial [Flavobacteriales bacterium]|nr:tetratricopeptide repeat protein [Flavobacteriales bacterium]